LGKAHFGRCAKKRRKRRCWETPSYLGVEQVWALRSNHLRGKHADANTAEEIDKITRSKKKAEIKISKRCKAIREYQVGKLGEKISR